HYDPVGFLSGWAALFGYSFQIYFDFSAYSDMAVGLGYMLGFRFPQNFNRPYIAQNVSEYWERWHMTLSRWLRDYLFIPLGGSRGTMAATARNLFITMFLGGLWHGANWTFVAWGLFHGAMLTLYWAFRRIHTKLFPVAKDDQPVSVRSIVHFSDWALTFLAVCFGWIFFRVGRRNQQWSLL